MPKKKLKVGDTIKWLSYGKVMVGEVVKIRKPQYENCRPIVVRPKAQRVCASIKAKNIIP